MHCFPCTAVKRVIDQKLTNSEFDPLNKIWTNLCLYIYIHDNFITQTQDFIPGDYD